MPLGGTAPVIGDGNAMSVTNGTTVYGLSTNGVNALSGHTGNVGQPLGTTTSGSAVSTTSAFGIPTTGSSGMVADLSAVTSATINQLREAFQVQGLLERDARGGTRYKEIIQGHFNVTSPRS